MMLITQLTYQQWKRYRDWGYDAADIAGMDNLFDTDTGEIPLKHEEYEKKYQAEMGIVDD